MCFLDKKGYVKSKLLWSVELLGAFYTGWFTKHEQWSFAFYPQTVFKIHYCKSKTSCSMTSLLDLNLVDPVYFQSNRASKSNRRLKRYNIIHVARLLPTETAIYLHNMHYMDMACSLDKRQHNTYVIIINIIIPLHSI